MALVAENDLMVASASYTAAQTVKPDIACRKLTLQVEGFTMYFQTIDVVHGDFNDNAPEIKVTPGFGSFTFTTPIYGFRWRKSEAATGNPVLSYTYDA